MAKRWTAKSPMSGYLVAIAATLTVLLLRLLLSPLLGDSAYFFPFVIAATVSAWYGGLNPGLLSTAMGSAIAVFFFVPPHYKLKDWRSQDCYGPAYDGEQALEMANELKPDVVLLDIGLAKVRWI